VLTARRAARAAQRPLTEEEFLGALARCPRVYADENERFHDFTDKWTGLAERRKKDDGAAPAKKAGDKGKVAAKKK
jgi:hypothetical protein